MATTVANAPVVVAEVPSFTVTFIVRRFDPENDAEPHWEDYDVQMFATDRVLDGLHKIKWEIDGTLSFRRSCAHGICGSDAMRINGRNRLACKTLIKDLSALTANAYKTDYKQIMELATEIREQAQIIRMWSFEKADETRPNP